MPTGTRPVGPRPPAVSDPTASRPRDQAARLATGGAQPTSERAVGRITTIRIPILARDVVQAGRTADVQLLRQVRAFVVVTAPLAPAVANPYVRNRHCRNVAARLLHRCASRSFGRTNPTSWAHLAARSGQPSIDATSVARAAVGNVRAIRLRRLPIPRAAPRVTATRGCGRSALPGDSRWTARVGVQERVGGRFVQPVLHADVASCRDRVAKQIEGLPGPARRRAQHDVRAIAASRIWSAMEGIARMPRGASGRSWSTSVGSSQRDFPWRSRYSVRMPPCCRCRQSRCR